jgi:hypothetical protein
VSRSEPQTEVHSSIDRLLVTSVAPLKARSIGSSTTISVSRVGDRQPTAWCAGASALPLRVQSGTLSSEI